MFENIVFFQGDEASEWLEKLDNEGAHAVLVALSEWHYPSEHDTRETLGAGSSDSIHESNGYTLAWNSRIGYIGLSFKLPQS